jgi:hypothetical protein
MRDIADTEPHPQTLDPQFLDNNVLLPRKKAR